MAAIDFEKMFDAYSDANEKEWKYDRTLSLGASEVFGCLRKAFFKKFGYEKDDGHEDDWGAAKRGDIIENHFAVPAVQAILPEGAELIYAGEEQETLKKGRLSATPDGLVLGVDRDALSTLPNGQAVQDILVGEFVTEFKSFDPRANIKEAKPIHIGQVQVQLGLIHALTNYRPEYGLVIYMNASFLTDIRIFTVKRDPEIFEAAMERAKQVYANENPKDLRAEGKLSGECSLCEFTEECAVAQGEATPKSKRKIEDQETLDRLATLVARQKEFDAIHKDAEKDKKLVEAEIKDILHDKDTKGAGDDRFNISLSWIGGKKSLDRLLLAADLEDISKFLVEHGEKPVTMEDYEKDGAGYERLVCKIKD